MNYFRHLLAALAVAAPCAAAAQDPSTPADPTSTASTAEAAPAAPAAEPAPAPEATAPPPAAAPANGVEVAWTTRNPAGFLAMTPAKAAFGVAGTMAMLGAGEQVVKENLMTEPAGAMSRDLARVVAERSGGVVRSEPAAATALKPEEIAAKAPGARYVVDVTTMGWSYIYQPFKWDTFNASYYARLQVIDGTTGKLLLKDSCAWPKKGQAMYATQDALLADQGRQLKQQIMMGTLTCRSQFLSKMDKLTF